PTEPPVQLSDRFEVERLRTAYRDSEGESQVGGPAEPDVNAVGQDDNIRHTDRRLLRATLGPGNRGVDFGYRHDIADQTFRSVFGLEQFVAHAKIRQREQGVAIVGRDGHRRKALDEEAVVVTDAAGPG